MNTLKTLIEITDAYGAKWWINPTTIVYIAEVPKGEGGYEDYWRLSLSDCEQIDIPESEFNPLIRLLCKGTAEELAGGQKTGQDEASLARPNPRHG